nr:hypothetical protein [Tanacetum cinerariifolium]
MLIIIELSGSKIHLLKNSLTGETVRNSLQQITHTLATLSTHENDERRNRGGPRLSRGRRNDQSQRQCIQPHGEDSDVEDEFEDGWIEGRRFGQRGAREFDYRQRAKDVLTFHGSMNVEDFLDWMSELDTFFKFYKIPMGSRVDLVANKLKGGAQSWWKNLQLIRERQGKLPITSNRSVEVYTAEFHRLSSRNDLSETESQQVTRDTGKQVVSTNTTSTKTTNPYARPVMGKCFKCGVPGHNRSNDCRDNGGKVNLTLRDDEFGNGGETNTSDEDVDAEICHPEGGDYPSTEYSTHSFVIQRILLASKVTDSSQRHNLFKTRCIIFQKVFNVIIDNGSTENIVSRDIVQRLRLPMEKHPNPYKVDWIKSVGYIKVTERCKIPFMIGKYKDEIIFNIADMDACHILLGRLWVYDVNATHKGKENTCTFHHDGVKMVLVPLSDGYNTNVSSSAECLAKETGSVEAKVKKK